LRPAAPQRSKGPGDLRSGVPTRAALLTVPAAFAYWGQRALNDTPRYVAAVGPLIDAPAVQDAIATRVTGVIDKQVDVEQILNDVFFPASLQVCCGGNNLTIGRLLCSLALAAALLAILRILVGAATNRLPSRVRRRSRRSPHRLSQRYPLRVRRAQARQ
jgi:hypothetical protein